MSARRRKSHDDVEPRLSDPTTVNPADPFDVTDRAATPAPPRSTQFTVDPDTVLVARGSFHELPAGCVVGETYEIELRLGAGAMGEVYAAHHVKLGKRVAIKVIGQRVSEDDAAIERFAMEARALARIQHPAIVAVEHIGELPDGRAYFVMEFLRGQSLFERLRRGEMSLSEALRIIDQMARGLEAAHAEGIIHRDIKPENTFLVHLTDEPPIVKIVDFGLAKLRTQDQRVEKTQSGVAIGTPMYMSPEQARGPNVDYRTDIYSLGCVAYELVLGVPPFPHAKTAPELYAAHLAEDPPHPSSIWPEIPKPLASILFAMLSKEPDRRPTLSQIRTVIAEVRADVAPRRAPTEAIPRGWRAHKQAIVIAVVTLMSGIAIGVTVSARRTSDKAGLREISPVQPMQQPVQMPSAAIQPVEPIQSSVPNAPSDHRSVSAASDPKPIPPQKTKPRAEARAIKPIPPAAITIDAGVDAEASPPRSPPPDRDRAVNPFTKKRREGP